MTSLLLVVAMCMSFAGCKLTTSQGDIEFAQQLTKLSAPSNVRVENDVVYWDSVANSGGYVVRINEKEQSTTQLSYPISAMVSSDSELHIRVKACGNKILYSDSDWSEIVTYQYQTTKIVQLSAPQNVRVEQNNVVWDSILDASGYSVRINNLEDTVSAAAISYPISALIDESGHLNIRVKALGDGTSFSDSVWSDPISYDYTKTKLPDPKKLEMPGNVFVEEDVIYWDSVAGATGYGIRINEKEDTVSAGTLSYPVSALISDSAYLNIRVRALGGGDLTDSDWTDIISYRYEKPGTGSSGGGEVSSATDYGIGYGYNIIEDEYFSSSKVSTASILDLNKASGYIRKTQESTSLSRGIYAESITDYAKEYSSKIGANFELSGGFAAFTTSLSLAFDLNQVEKFSSKEKQVYYTYFDNVGTYYYRMKNYNIDALRGMLSEIFLSDLNRQSTATKNLKSDEALAQYLIDTYGTHLITGVQLGGRIEYSYLISTSNTTTFSSLESMLSAKFSAGISGLVSGSTSASASEKLDECLNESGTSKKITIRSYGGASVGLWNEDTLNQNYTEWAKSLNQEEYMNAVGLAPNGMVALWSLIPDTNEYHSLIVTMEQLFEKKGAAIYNSTIEKYTSHKQEGLETTGTLTFDLSECYESTKDGQGMIDSFNLEKLSNVCENNYDKVSGIFTLTGAQDGTAVNHYIIKGMHGLSAKDGHIVRASIHKLSFQILSEHDITIEFQNISFSSRDGFPAVYNGSSENKNITVTIVTGGIVEMFGSDEQNGLLAQPAIRIDAANCVFDVSGTLLLTGGNAAALSDGADGLIAKSLVIKGSGTNSITIRGGNGANGADGEDGEKGASASYRQTGKTGSNGTQGLDGKQGGFGISASDITINSGTVNLIGGNGGHGGNGGKGGQGGAGGSGEFNWGYHLPGAGGLGGNGGNGGNGGKAGLPFSLDDNQKLQILDGQVTLETGTPGDGGAGGQGGKGGTGGYADWPNTWGAKGGNGGTGGDGGNCFIVNEKSISDLVSSTQNSNITYKTTRRGTVGAAGLGGDGGDGGPSNQSNRGVSGQGGAVGKAGSQLQ